MFHRVILFFALLLPIQFAWSAAAAYCEHESAASDQSSHFGHHFHEHKGEAESTSGIRLAADPDCASCNAASTAAITPTLDRGAVAPSTAFAAHGLKPAFASTPSRAPDRPQWLRLV